MFIIDISVFCMVLYLCTIFVMHLISWQMRSHIHTQTCTHKHIHMRLLLILILWFRMYYIYGPFNLITQMLLHTYMHAFNVKINSLYVFAFTIFVIYLKSTAVHIQICAHTHTHTLTRLVSILILLGSVCTIFVIHLVP